MLWKFAFYEKLAEVDLPFPNRPSSPSLGPMSNTSVNPFDATDEGPIASRMEGIPETPPPQQPRGEVEGTLEDDDVMQLAVEPSESMKESKAQPQDPPQPSDARKPRWDIAPPSCSSLGTKFGPPVGFCHPYWYDRCYTRNCTLEHYRPDDDVFKKNSPPPGSCHLYWYLGDCKRGDTCKYYHSMGSTGHYGPSSHGLSSNMPPPPGDGHHGSYGPSRVVSGGGGDAPPPDLGGVSWEAPKKQKQSSPESPRDGSFGASSEESLRGTLAGLRSLLSQEKKRWGSKHIYVRTDHPSPH